MCYDKNTGKKQKAFKGQKSKAEDLNDYGTSARAYK